MDVRFVMRLVEFSCRIRGLSLVQFSRMAGPGYIELDGVAPIPTVGIYGRKNIPAVGQ